MKSFMIAMHMAAMLGVPEESVKLEPISFLPPSREKHKAEVAAMRAELNEPVHGKGGWELAKYEWREDGSARFLYVRNTGERRSVIRQQKAWCV